LGTRRWGSSLPRWIAALVSPLRRWVQRIIDRRLYRTRYDTAATLAAFAATLRHGAYADLAQLNDGLVAVVEQTMRPAHVSLWLKPDPGRNPRL